MEWRNPYIHAHGEVVCVLSYAHHHITHLVILGCLDATSYILAQQYVNSRLREHAEDVPTGNVDNSSSSEARNAALIRSLGHWLGE